MPLRTCPSAPRHPLSRPEPPAAATPPRPASPLSRAARHASVGLSCRPPHERVGLLAASRTIDSSASCLCGGARHMLSAAFRRRRSRTGERRADGRRATKPPAAETGIPAGIDLRIVFSLLLHQSLRAELMTLHGAKAFEPSDSYLRALGCSFSGRGASTAHSRRRTPRRGDRPGIAPPRRLAWGFGPHALGHCLLRTRRCRAGAGPRLGPRRDGPSLGGLCWVGEICGGPRTGSPSFGGWRPNSRRTEPRRMKP